MINIPIEDEYLSIENDIKRQKIERINNVYKVCILDGINEYFKINFYDNKDIDKKNVLIKQILNDCECLNYDESCYITYKQFFRIIMTTIFNYNAHILEELFFKRKFKGIEVDLTSFTFIFTNDNRIIIASDKINDIKNPCIYLANNGDICIFKSVLNALIITDDFSYIKSLIYSFIKVIRDRAEIHIKKYMTYMTMCLNYESQ